MVLLFIIITLIYLIVIGSFTIGFNKIHAFNFETLPPKTKFTIVIPFRNEAKNLPDLLSSIRSLEYANHMFEVILVDDESSDH